MNFKLVMLFSAFWCFLMPFGAFWYFLVLFGDVKSYRKKKIKSLKNDLITSLYILLTHIFTFL